MILRKRAEEIINLVDKTEEEFSVMGNIISGDIYIGAAESYTIKYIAQILKEIQKKTSTNSFSFIQWK